MEELQKHLFNQMANEWHIPIQNIVIAEEIIHRLGLQIGDSVLDVGCGTGILYNLLSQKNIYNYVGVDISEKMLAKFKEGFPDVDLVCGDFENEALELKRKFDYCIIFNSIPHFNYIDKTFRRAYEHLKEKGKLVVIHCRTREGLKQHHQSIGYKSLKIEPIPLDEELLSVCKEVGFNQVVIEDKEYFYFEATKN